ncbi:hypothetical protein HYH02_008175 [Chlamydomonas schloesseri]|uniref:Uncharacterized protein n=1 Tax=Chlamydomonas schloesseri TaxID=2026947 RepID=A0A836B4B8_9CHLO|nr:hypothetical protein HYH02_008175 [Chlamydomonas schloesseri]|eukprot:KAG2447023.1 hypothetical protein HYH02_008175 [Chlamydomonas schloesseri]
MQDLLQPEPDSRPRSQPLLQRRLAGLLMVLGAVGLVIGYTAHAVVVLAPPEHLPSFLDAMRKYSELIFRATFTFHVTALAALVHWFSRKLFKHNSA